MVLLHNNVICLLRVCNVQEHNTTLFISHKECEAIIASQFHICLNAAN